jgi:uncharacterized membrane protein
VRVRPIWSDHRLVTVEEAMMDVVRVLALGSAAVTVGLMAGVFFAYAVSVMPGLARTDDRTFVGAFQAIDRAIMNRLFLSVFAGAPLLTVVAGLLHLGGEFRAVLFWTLGAFVLYLVAFMVTGAVNVPLNNAIKSAGDPDEADVAAVRAAFAEERWARWNTVRTVVTTGALVCLVAALVAHGTAA